MKSLKIQKEVIRSCESKENRQNNGQNRQSEAVNGRTDKTMAKKRQSETVNRRKTNKTMAKRGNQKL